MHAVWYAALGVGLMFGVIAQRSRMCFAGSLRDIILLKDFRIILSNRWNIHRYVRL